MHPEPLMHKSIRSMLVIASLFVAAGAQADNWPSRLIRATIPFGAGSAADVVPRLVFDRLAAELGQPIVIENRAGAGGTLGSAAVAKPSPTATPSSPIRRRSPSRRRSIPISPSTPHATSPRS
jgi:tripartite-type tricarboxylate transporter receptor subunit TctC